MARNAKMTGLNGMFKVFAETNGLLKGGSCPECSNQLFAPKKFPNSWTCPNCGYRTVLSRTAEERIRDMEIENRKSEALSYMTNTSCFGSLSVLNYKFSNYSPLDQIEANIRNHAMKIADEIAHDIKSNPKHIMLTGGTGRGKTHIAMAMAYYIMEKSEYSVPVKYKVGEKKNIRQAPIAITFVNWDNFMELKQDGINDRDKEKQFKLVDTSLKTADIAIIDDLGKEKANDWNFRTLDSLMEVREDQHIIVTTNLEGKDLRPLYGDRAISRLTKHVAGNIISFGKVRDHRMLEVSGQ